MRQFFVLPLLFIADLSMANAEMSTIRQQYISQWKDEAIYQMVVNKIPASITLAQGILESGDGKSRLATEGNNHFGIKCHTDWKGKTISEDDENKGECFRKYDNARESYEDHSAFLKRSRYESLFGLDTDDYKGWAKGLKQCGYATNPKYPDLLIGIIEEFGLTEHDKQGMLHIKKNEVPERARDNSTQPNLSNEKEKTPTRNTRKRDNDQRTEITVSNSREIKQSNNNIKYTVVKKGDTPSNIAEDLDMNEWQIIRYNDLKENADLKEGQIIYIQPKRNKSKTKVCDVKKGDTLWSISQEHGIRLNKLAILNGMNETDELKTGQQLKLRK